MSKNRIFNLLIAAAAFMVQSCATQAITDTQAITNTNVFDPVTGTMLTNRTIVFEHDRITGIIDSSGTVPASAKKIDGRGKYVIPGLIDAHAHLIFLLDSAHVKGEEVMPLYLGTGVTSVRDIGDGFEQQKRLREFARQNPATSPTVFMCSPLIDGLNPYHGADPVSIPMTDTARVPGYIDSLAVDGVTTLKIYVYADSAVFKKVVEEGHKHGLTVSAHLPSGKVNTKDALDWKLDVIEHIFGAPEDPALIAQMAAQGTMLDPTLIVFKNMLLMTDRPEVYNNRDNYYVPAAVRQYWDGYRKTAAWINVPHSEENLESRKATMQGYLNTVGKLHRAGVELLAGTDSPEPYCPPGFALHDELALLVEAGLTPAEALKCATLNNAKALKQTDNLGTIAAGKIADMVILNANPLSDIHNTRSIYRVIHSGIVCDPATVLPKPQMP